MAKFEERGDYHSVPVPVHARRSALQILLAFLGFIIVVGVMAVGGGLAPQMPLRSLLGVIILGNLVLGVFAAIAGWVGAESGKSFNLLLSDAFSDSSWRVASLYVPIVLVGWYAIEAAIFGHLVADSLGVGNLATERVVIFVSGILFATTAYLGFSAIRYVSLALVPILVAAGSYAIYAASMVEEAGATFGFGDTQIGLGAGLAIVMGTWIMGSLTAVQDLTRFCRTPLAGALVGFFGIVLANTFTLLVGAAGAGLTGESDPAAILVSLGLISVALLFGVANIWTTNDNNMYSASLHVARVARLERPKAVLICALLGAAFAIFEPYKLGFLFTFLGFLGGTAPALGAVVLLNYWKQRSGLDQPSGTSLPAWVGWIGGSAVGLAVGGWLAPFLGFAIGMGFFTAIDAMLARRERAS